MVKLLRRTSKPAEPGDPGDGRDKAATDSPTSPTDSRDPRQTAGKGRPTPKRREAQGRRAGPLPPPPKTRREAYRRMRQRNTGRRDEVKQGMRAGDDRYLAARDRGPVRALVRDIVDSRRNIGSIFLVVAALVLVGYVVPSPQVRTWTLSLWMAVFVLIIGDSFVLSARIRRMVRERFPDQAKARGLVWYGVQRSTMIRRWRMPHARVKPGDPI